MQRHESSALPPQPGPTPAGELASEAVELEPARSVKPIAAVLALAFLLRAFWFWKPELWLDEYGTWWVVAAGDLGEVTRRALEIQGQSPLYYWLVRFSVALFGDDAFALRLPSVLAGTAVVFVGWRIALRVFRDRHTALIAAIVLAVSGHLLEASQDARPYSLAILLVSLSFLYLLRLLERWSWRDAALHALVSAGVFYAHYVFTLALLVQAVYLAFRPEPRRSPARWLALAALIVALSLPGVPQLQQLFARRGALNWLPVEGALATAGTALYLLQAFLGAPFLLLALAASVATRAVREARGHPRPAVPWGLLALWLLLPIGALAFLPGTIGVSLLDPRYLLWVAPAGALVGAWALGLGRKSPASRWAPLAVYLVVLGALELVPNLWRYGTFGWHYSDFWNAAVTHLESRAAPHERVYHSSGFVEQDLTCGETPDPTRLSFVEAPLRANLEGWASRELVGLPFRDLALVELRFVQANATLPPGARFWAIGRGPAFADFVGRAPERLSARIVDEARFGSLRVLALERGQ